MNWKPREILDSGLRLKNGQSVRGTERFENIGVNIGTQATEKDGPVHETL